MCSHDYFPVYYLSDPLDNSFEYITDRIRLTPKDLKATRLERPLHLHFICSPTRAESILYEVERVPGWDPYIIYEPVPVSVILESNSSNPMGFRTSVYLTNCLHSGE